MTKYDSSKPFKTVYGEPVIRPDTFELELYRTQHGDLIVHLGRGPVAQFTETEVELIGSGNFDAGALIIGKAHFEADIERFDNNDHRVLHHELLPPGYHRQ